MQRTFDRIVRFDERSRSFPIMARIDARSPRTYTWACDTFLDQGREGACVGHAFAHEAAARPSISAANSQLAFRLYNRAKQLDEWPGESYDGTSILAGAKAFVEAGYAGEYRWAFGLQDLIMAVGYSGPAVIGVNWHQGMTVTDQNGFIHPTGEIIGGHAILVRGVNVRLGHFLLHNSWGRRWGLGGTCRISYAGMAQLLRNNGEACIPVLRKIVKLV